MPTPINPHSSYGQKLISLFARLLFSKKEYSLIDLAKLHGCSKQTIMRLIEDIRMSFGVDIEDRIVERRKYYRLKRVSGAEPLQQLSKNELMTLQMCMSFTEHLLGKELFTETTEELEKSQLLLSGGQRTINHFGTFYAGRIDYSSHQDTIRSTIDAMDKKKICEVKYQKIMSDKAKEFSIEPLKIFSHQDTIYLHARLRKDSKKNHYFLLAIHRIKGLKVTDMDYEIPEDYDFDKLFNQNFGVIKHDTFPVTIEFNEYAAAYVAERVWNSETRKEWIDDDTLILSFEASSKYELIGWVLSWAGKAKVLEPQWLVDEIRDTIQDML